MAKESPYPNKTEHFREVMERDSYEYWGEFTKNGRILTIYIGTKVKYAGSKCPPIGLGEYDPERDIEDFLHAYGIPEASKEGLLKFHPIFQELFAYLRF